MEAVLRLVKDSPGMSFEGFFVDFLSAVGRKAVHDHDIFAGELNERAIDLVASQLSDAVGGFGFFAHGNPNVGIEEVSAFGSGLDVLRANNFSWGASQQTGGGLIRFRCSNPKLEVEFGGGKDPGNRNITGAIADESDDPTFD